jgi:actin-related protein
MENGIKIEIENDQMVVELLDHIVIERLKQALKICDPDMTGHIERVLSYFGG